MRLQEFYNDHQEVVLCGLLIDVRRILTENDRAASQRDIYSTDDVRTFKWVE